MADPLKTCSWVGVNGKACPITVYEGDYCVMHGVEIEHAEAAYTAIASEDKKQLEEGE